MTARSLDPAILRRYDIRGTVGDAFGAADAVVVGRAFATLAGESAGRRPRVLVGRDGRLSSPELEQALVAGLTASGASVGRIGLGPSPLLYFAALAEGADGAVMVTGSHNPADQNGFKMMLAGRPFFGADIARLAGRAAAGAFADGAGAVDTIAPGAAYVDRLLADYDGTRPLTVVWDPGNGATAGVVSELARRLPGRHVVLNGTVDGRFPAHAPDPVEPANLTQLIAAVGAEGADLGVAFDGDGDRLGVVDGTGRILWADQLLMLLAEEVLAARPGAPVLADVKASQALFDRIRALGGEPVMCPTGRPLIQVRMAETGAPLAGEMSGHLFFADRYLGFDDALYAAVRVIALVARGDPARPLARRAEALPRLCNTPELRIPCGEAAKFAVVDAVRRRLAAAGATLCEIDGVRVATPDGWWLLRASHTQAALTARCESATPEGLERLKTALAAELAAAGLAL